jgi:hypothetical protein
MNIESLEVITIVNESLAQCYSQLHAIHLTSDILKQKNVTFCDDESLYYTCHYLKNFTFHLYIRIHELQVMIPCNPGKRVAQCGGYTLPPSQKAKPLLYVPPNF